MKDALKEFNYFDFTPVSTLMDTSEKLMPNNGQVVSQLEYFRVIDCLMHDMTCIRPDIASAMGKLSSGYPLVLEGYTDASWISNSKENLYTSGWVFLLGGASAGARLEDMVIKSAEVMLNYSPTNSMNAKDTHTLLRNLGKAEFRIWKAKRFRGNEAHCIYISFPMMCLEPSIGGVFNFSIV
ncbi:hypothetical protein Tco_1459434 [Tanacetum coccineum]